jgi:hypothetical protein
LLYLSWFSMRRQTKKILRCQCIIESYEAIYTIIHMCIFLLLELIQMITWTSFEIDQTTYLSLVKSSSTLMTLLCRIWWSFDCQTAAALLRNRCLYNRVFPRFSLDSTNKTIMIKKKIVFRCCGYRDYTDTNVILQEWKKRPPNFFFTQRADIIRLNVAHFYHAGWFSDLIRSNLNRISFT